MQGPTLTSTREPPPNELRRPGGFTLVELLVVIAIIAMVTGLLLPAFVGALAQARAVVCANNVRQIVIGMQGYASDHAGHYPINVRLPSPGFYWYDRQRVGAFLGGRPQADGGALHVLRCPEDSDAVRSYSMNFWASSAVEPGEKDSASADWPGGRFWKQPTRGAWKLILVTEAFSGRGSATAGWVAPPTVGAQGVAPGLRFGAGGGVPTSAGRFGMVFSEIDYGRHRLRRGNGSGTEPAGRAHFGYADGHVSLVMHTDLADPVTGKSRLDSLWSPKDPALQPEEQAAPAPP
jgi:prepilin-type N-terminal cleavage/methylation domain-containing protein/prepilin-type processing-associated H-X9-DG protein